MAHWDYTITNGTILHTAIENGSTKETIDALIMCLDELYSKLTSEDKAYIGYDIEDMTEVLKYMDASETNEDELDDYLADFYDMCDSLRAWITL
jgi:hypothetical protein